jgi:glycosyltransferase involved in cell wall biosynthesis
MVLSLQPELASAKLTAHLAVVVPIYNEQTNISPVVNEWKDAFAQFGIDCRLVLISNVSKDSTFDVLKELESEDPNHLDVTGKLNSGNGQSCRTVYDATVASEAVEWILQDEQYDPDNFAEFWRRREFADCVFGKRVQRDDGCARALTSKI